MKNIFASLGVLAALVGTAICGAMLCMGNASADASALKDKSGPVSAAVSLASSDVYDYVRWDRESLKSMFYDGGTYYLFSTCPVCGGHESTDVTPDSDTMIVAIKSGGVFETPCSYGIMHNVDGESKCMELFCLLHDGEEVVLTEPTCTTAGTSVIRCKDCGDQGDTKSIPETGHDYGAGVSLPVSENFCSETQYTCKDCGSSYYSLGGSARQSHNYTVVERV